MKNTWIWLPEKTYPERQNTYYSTLCANGAGNYTVAEFVKAYRFEKKTASVSLCVSGDTAFRLYANGELVCTGPATPGGDFLDNETPRPNFYRTEFDLPDALLSPEELSFRAEVRMMPERMCEYSKGHGGFFLSGKVVFSDGSEAEIGTDGTWDVRLLPAYTAPGRYDNEKEDLPYEKAQEIRDLWHTELSPIPPCVTEPAGETRLTVPAHKTLSREIALPCIAAGYPYLRAEGVSGDLSAKLSLCETEEDGGTSVSAHFVRDGEYCSFAMNSAGLLRAEIENTGDKDAAVTVGFLTSYFPITRTARTETSDKDLDAVLATSVSTLKYCRQTHHLDSPRHCEPLACTGDYYIETLMTAFSFGDLRLAAFDVRRTAVLLTHHDGRMFHTTYSLIWVRMLWDTYLYSGEYALLTDCRHALDLLLARFRTYIGENGLIETPPDYMFVDWLFPDGISTHHPPKALGQTCLCLFYYGALLTAKKIYETLGEPVPACACESFARDLHRAVYENLWDPEKKLFFEGLNTPTPEHLLYEYMPQNVEKRYYRMHANILAAYVGFFSKEENAALLERILSDETMEPVQPYFMHYLLEAVYRNGLRENYTLPLLDMWKEPVKACPGGLTEGFYKPEPTYRFDHSHAWGGTPAYALPLALSGLEIAEAGYKKIRLSPSLLSLDSAIVRIPAPQGDIVIRMKKGTEPEITVPDGITLLSL